MRRTAQFMLVMSLVVVIVAGGCRAKERREARQAGNATATAQASVGALTGAPSPEAQGQQAPETRAAPPAPTTCPADATTGLSLGTITAGGIERGYRLYVPSSYDASTPLAMVLNFHGFGSNAAQQEDYSGFVSHAEANGFVLVTPDGSNNPQRWYIYGRLEPGFVDDFAFVEALIDTVSTAVCIDPARIFAAGISNGGGMSALLGCRSDRIAAVAPVAGAPFNASICTGAGPMPVIAFHGTEDDLVPFDGGSGGRLGLPIRPVRDNMRGWAEHNGCDLTLQTERIAADVVLERYTDCNEDAEVLLYVIEGGGHTWPGSGRGLAGVLRSTTQSIDASELIWQFFASH